MLPVVSIVLALGLPAYALWRNGRRALRRPYLFSVGSFLFCSAGMLAELFAVRRRVAAGDIGGLADTMDAVLMLCVGLLLLTVILNVLLLGLSYERDEMSDGGETAKKRERR